VKTRASRALPILGSALALAGLTLPAFAADAPTGAEKAKARAAVVESQLTDAQKRAVAEFRVQFDQSQGPARVQATTSARIRKAQPGDRTLQVAVAKRNADGTFALSCVDDAAQFAEFLAEAKTAVESDGKGQ
jgi:hypothetical protein